MTRTNVNINIDRLIFILPTGLSFANYEDHSYGALSGHLKCFIITLSDAPYQQSLYFIDVCVCLFYRMLCSSHNAL